MINTKTGFELVKSTEGEYSDMLEFKVLYFDNRKRIVLSVTNYKKQDMGNGIIIREMTPLDDGNFNIVLEELDRKNSKKVLEYIEKVQDNSKKLLDLYNQWLYGDLYDFVKTL